jgi:hypothetical protein
MRSGSRLLVPGACASGVGIRGYIPAAGQRTPGTKPAENKPDFGISVVMQQATPRQGLNEMIVLAPGPWPAETATG